jgi:hypothetical protein
MGNIFCEGFISTQTSENARPFVQATRGEALSVAVRMKRINTESVPLVSENEFTRFYTDVTLRNPWISVVETALKHGILTQNNGQFARTMNRVTRSEAYAMIMASVCLRPRDIDPSLWQSALYDTAREQGLTVRDWSIFEPNRYITRYELFALSARAADWAEKTGGCNPKPAMCEGK